jgi:glycosyltransferase involved in cell wall biosynthesis
MEETRSGTRLAISVGICTRNRAAMLQTSLEWMARMRVPDDIAWEVLVVDNGSTDDTRSRLDRLRDNLPLRVLSVSTPGQSRARNAAIAEARGDYILWTDDDVLVDPGWVAGYVRVFRQRPEAAFFGGPIEPWFEGTPPGWLKDHWHKVGNVFAVRELGDTPLQFTSDLVPYGANYAVKTSVQRSFQYDPQLGLQPGSEIRAEETKGIREMLAAGHAGWWVPDARVQHFVPRHRQSVAYLRSFFVGQGEVQSRLFARADVPRLFGRPRWLLKRALAAEARYRWSRITASPDIWLDRLIEAATAWGHLKAAP